MNPVNLAYVAGVLDCDGSIKVDMTANRKSVQCSLIIYNSERMLLEKCKAVIGGSVCGPYFHNVKQKKPYFHLNLYAQKTLLEVLKALLPYLVIKKKIALKMVEYLEYRVNKFHKRQTKEDTKFFNEIRSLQLSNYEKEQK